MKKLSFFAFAMLAVLLLSSCKASKNVAYIQNSDSISYEQSRLSRKCSCNIQPHLL